MNLTPDEKQTVRNFERLLHKIYSSTKQSEPWYYISVSICSHSLDEPTLKYCVTGNFNKSCKGFPTIYEALTYYHDEPNLISTQKLREEAAALIVKANLIDSLKSS
jgi:hypothetical protein